MTHAKNPSELDTALFLALLDERTYTYCLNRLSLCSSFIGAQSVSFLKHKYTKLEQVIVNNEDFTLQSATRYQMPSSKASSKSRRSPAVKTSSVVLGFILNGLCD